MTDVKESEMVNRSRRGSPSQLQVGVLSALVLLAAPFPLWAQSPIVPSEAKLEKVFDGGMVLTEGVAVAPDGQVFFSDITFSHVSKETTGRLEAGHIWKFDPATGKASIFRSPSGMSNG